MARKKKTRLDVVHSEGTPIWVDDKGVVHEGVRPAAYKSLRKSETRLNSYGEIIEDSPTDDEQIYGVTSDGDRYFRRQGGEYLKLRSQDGKMHEMRVKKNHLGPIVNEYINYLIDSKIVNLPKKKNSDIIFLEGAMPTKVRVGNHYEYAGKCERLDSQKNLVVVDNSLSQSEKIATLYHELMHARGIGSDREAHTATIEGLRAMMKTYPHLMRHEEEWGKYFNEGNDPDILEEGSKYETLRGAVNYALTSRSSFDIPLKDIKQRFRNQRSNLERYVGVLFCCALFGAVITYSQALQTTGRSISEGAIISGGFLGIAVFFLAVAFLGLFVNRIRKKYL